jgi:hypothetical protein
MQGAQVLYREENGKVFLSKQKKMLKTFFWQKFVNVFKVVFK